MFTLAIKTDNAAFEDRNAEVARILRDAAEKVEDFGLPESGLLDVNGNLVGGYKFMDVTHERH